MQANWLREAFTALLAQSGWEWLAVILGIGYVILAANNSKWAWPSAFFSTLIYTVLFWEGQLPLQALMNAYYLLMAVYGFWLWNHSEKHPSKTQTADSVTIHSKPLPFHISYILIGITLSVLTGLYLEANNYSQFPYLEAFVTVFSVINTVLMARRILENWLYWLVIDSFAIYLYWQSGFYVTIIMFSLYLILAVYGYLEWRHLRKRRLNKQQTAIA